MKIGIVTTWFERGAAYVSKSFRDILTTNKENEVFIFARGGEKYAKGDKNWDSENVFWSTRMRVSGLGMVMNKKEFYLWVKQNKIELIIFNEQQWFEPLLWCKELKVKTIAYIDYYTNQTLPLFDIYDALICNTKRHHLAFRNHHASFYLPWGTDLEIFSPTNTNLVNQNYITFFHSCGHDKFRKGVDYILTAFNQIDTEFKLIIHTQVPFKDEKHLKLIESLQSKGRLEIICETVSAPGLFHLGDIYVYPSRLEGIGLTIAEALASGLGLIVTDMPPMNEFSNDRNSLLIKTKYQYAREDGYYWPLSELDIEDFIDKVSYLCMNKEKVVSMKNEARLYAETNLNASVNLLKLNEIVKEVSFRDVQPELAQKIKAYDLQGIKKLSKFKIKYYFFYNLIRVIKNKI